MNVQIRKKFSDLLFLCAALFTAFFLYRFIANGNVKFMFNEIIAFANKQDSIVYKSIVSNRMNIIEKTYDNSSTSYFLEMNSSKFIISTRLSALMNYTPKTPLEINNENKHSNIIKQSNQKKSNNQKNNSKQTPQVNEITIKAPNLSITNLSNKKIDVTSFYNKSLNFKYSKSKGNIILYHTHTSEGYLDNKNAGVVEAGKIVNNVLESKFKFNVIHNITNNDKDYNLAYTKGLNTLTQILRGNKKNNLILDIHRDANNPKKPLRVVKEFNGEKYAQIMIVVGTNVNETNANWERNITLALKLQYELNKIVPGICRPTYITNKRYNQHVGTNNIIIELGADGNKQSEANLSASVIAKAINNLFEKNK